MINDPNYVPYTKSVGEPERGDSAYGTNEYAKNTPLDVADTGGVVGMPSIGGDYAFNSLAKGAGDTSGAHGVVETTASQEKLSAKYKYPNVHQDVPEKGRGQFEDHT